MVAAFTIVLQNQNSASKMGMSFIAQSQRLHSSKRSLEAPCQMTINLTT